MSLNIDLENIVLVLEKQLSANIDHFLVLALESGISSTHLLAPKNRYNFLSKPIETMNIDSG